MSQTFTTQIELHGKTATGFRVPDEVVEAMGSGKRPKVLVTIGPHTYRSTIAVYTGVYMLPLNADNREAAGVKAGDTVEVTLAPDTEERRVEVPAELAAAFAAHPGTQAAFEALSFTRQREHAEAVTSAKQEATRERRIAKIIAELGAG
jgi:Bacteriocin-protection, YdeI or OmpD-Associated/Domain of unknown function (DUF1905)